MEFMICCIYTLTLVSVWCAELDYLCPQHLQNTVIRREVRFGIIVFAIQVLTCWILQLGTSV